MTYEPLTQVQVEMKLREIVKMQEAKSDDYDRLCLIAAEADHAYRLAKAQELLKADGGTVAERDAKALIAIQVERLEAKAACAERDACQERLRTLRSEATALVTLLAAVRDQTVAT